MAKFLVTLTDEERCFLRKMVSSGKGAARKLLHGRILLQAFPQLIEFQAHFSTPLHARRGTTAHDIPDADSRQTAKSLYGNSLAAPARHPMKLQGRGENYAAPERFCAGSAPHLATKRSTLPNCHPLRR